jgi:two-component system, NtrC family, nitrogen regulation sensor histidine kinase GlnL
VHSRLATPLTRPLAWIGLDSLVSLVIVVDSRGVVLALNSAAQNALLPGRNALIGTDSTQLFEMPAVVQQAMGDLVSRRSDAARLDAMLRQTLRDPLSAADGGALVPVHVLISRAEAGDCYLMELIEFEQQAKLVREERMVGLSQANKELVRNLAHEIKNPLGGIRGAAQLLQMEIDEQARHLGEYTRVIIAEADRLQTLVDRLLAPHRRPQLIGDVNVHEVLERVLALIAAEFPQGLALVRDYDTSLPEFRGDKEQLIQAVLNIAHNAAQALTERRSLGDAEIRFQTRIARQITFGGQRHRLALDLHIVDNGPGVPEDIRDRIFYPLVSGREGGSGLGLTLAQTFVQQHGGLIECESRPGRTNFRVLIPLP